VEERHDIDDAARTLRKVRQSVPVAFGRRKENEQVAP
jgi:hypothetical protein